MKDPLQKKSTPYEELGVGENSDKKTIDDAFKQAIGKGKNIKEVTQARTCLSKPVDRGLVDLFLYNDAYISKLEFDPNISPIEFNIQRTELGRRWAITQQNGFPCWAATHSLAVLWYWLAISEEENRLNSKSMSDPEPLNLYWYHVIGLWGALVNTPSFWKDWLVSKESVQGYFGEDQITVIRQALETQFVNHFISVGERYRALDDLKSVKRMQKYEALWSSELKTGRRLNKSGVSIVKGGRNVDITYGRFFLDHVGFLAIIKQQLEQILSGNPKNEEIQALKNCLSPYFYIFILVENKKYDDALSEIENLLPSEQKTEEIQGLQAEIYLEKGKQYFSINQFDNAFDAWQKGYEIEILRKQIYDTAVSSIKTKAVALQQTQLALGIELLEKGVKIFNDSGLKSVLSELYNFLGVKILNEAHAELKKPKGERKPNSELLITLRQAETIFRNAISLGKVHPDIERNLANALQTIKDLEDGFYDLSPEVRELILQSDEAFARTGKPDESLIHLEKALTISKTEIDVKFVKKTLAIYLNLRAVNIINKVTDLLNRYSSTFEFSLAQRIDDFMNGREPGSFFGKPAAKKKKSKLVIWWIFGILVLIGIVYLAIKNKGKSKEMSFGETVLFFVIYFFVIYIIPWIYNAIKNKVSSGYRYNNPYGGYTSTCRLCNNNAAYVYNLEGYGSVNLCYTHTDKLKEVLQPKPYIDPMTRSDLNRARNDLNRAAEYDPSMKVVQDNMRILNEYLAMP